MPVYKGFYNCCKWIAIFTIWIVFAFNAMPASGQQLAEIVAAEQKLQQQLDSLQMQQQLLQQEMEAWKLARIRAILQLTGTPDPLPGNTVVWHSAMALEYSEAHEQARWVAHVILPDIATGVVARTNDFRPDSLIATGSAVEADYFLKFLQPDSSYKYDGFGYDRGHLAPSADFRWSYKALSESYLYSNMSPQVDSFNRGIWVDIEDKLREYVLLNQGTNLVVLTGQVLTPDLRRIERGPNKVAIPRLFWKVAYDPLRNRAIAFVLPNTAGNRPPETYAVTPDSVQRLTGIALWPRLDKELRQDLLMQRRTADWFAEVASGDVEPVPVSELRRGQLNTGMAASAMGSRYEVDVIGKVVSARTSRAGNVLLNLDKQYPNEVFTIFIKKEDLPNFNFDPVKALKGRRVVVRGKVADLGGKPVMYLSREKNLLVMPEYD
ncbi:MAG: DNA/RNA non-specific endonuclease [Chitinophagaceae bacterium]|nr:DNA/RNA non-specific endonuclease [Chitinophagaceae bacterium]